MKSQIQVLAENSEIRLLPARRSGDAGEALVATDRYQALSSTLFEPLTTRDAEKHLSTEEDIRLFQAGTHFRLYDN